ncbi:MAG: hypothetical protein JWR18_3512 [Segetibacter sp.]|jgi:hypothetical protein|nr:hypothetical protein [Segetibacter sp.]
MNKKFVIAFFICMSPFFGIAQDISGFWEGGLDMFDGCFKVNNIELQISIKGDSIYGSSYHYLNVENYVKKNFTGTYDRHTKKIVLHERTVTTYKIPGFCTVCIKRYELTYMPGTSREFLDGGWTSVVTADFASCGSGAIKLSRVRESAFKEIPEINVDTGLLRLDFYDNGQVDDDSISVKINNVTVLTHQKLSAKPITAFIRIDLKNTFQEVEMIAENLGSIPPNTALLIITAGEKRYELFLSSSTKKSAKVRFLYEK